MLFRQTTRVQRSTHLPLEAQSLRSFLRADVAAGRGKASLARMDFESGTAPAVGPQHSRPDGPDSHRTMFQRHRRDGVRSPAFTLVEMIIAIGLVTVLSLVLGRLLLSGVDAFNYATARKQALRQARIALSGISRELRQVKDSSSITEATSTSITFTNVDDEQVTIEFRNGRILRNSVPVARNVTAFQLHFYDQDGNELSLPINDPSVVRAVKIVLHVSVEGREIALETEVRPRNL